MTSQKLIFLYSILFSAVIVFLIFYFDFSPIGVQLLPDTGASHYYWKLPVRENMIMLCVWALYGLHQISIWLLLLRQKNAPNTKGTVALLLTNGFFVIAHLLQTQFFYDGLAQDSPIWLPQVLVIIVLVFILILRSDKRGLFFGKPLKSYPNFKQLLRKYHGVFASFAIIFTFWFHPMVATSGHLIGFFYLFLLLMQVSFAFTSLHTNRYWIFALEIGVLFHGTLVAVGQGNHIWPMFLFGFGFLAVVTQIYDIGLKALHIRMLQAFYLATLVYVYALSSFSSVDKMQQVLYIPFIEYGVAFLLMMVGERLARKRTTS